MDLTFSNTNISSFFNEDGTYIPSDELLYLHTHPLIRPNFVDQLEAHIMLAGEVIQKKNLKGKPVEELRDIAIAIGRELPELTKENASRVLIQMRKAYKICSKLIGKQLP